MIEVLESLRDASYKHNDALWQLLEALLLMPNRDLTLSYTSSSHLNKGIRRLRLLDGLLMYAQSLSVYQSETGESTALVLDLGSMRFTLILSADLNRGFSGEGNVLEQLVQTAPETWIYGMKATVL